MGDKEQLKILDEKFLERKHLLSAIIERFLDNESYYGLSFTSLMENASSSIAAFGVNYRVQGQGNEQYLQSSEGAYIFKGYTNGCWLYSRHR